MIKFTGKAETESTVTMVNLPFEFNGVSYDVSFAFNSFGELDDYATCLWDEQGDDADYEKLFTDEERKTLEDQGYAVMEKNSY